MAQTTRNVFLTIDQGKLKGKIINDNGFGTKYYSFQGIPYAKPPLGKLRFKAPEPAGEWIGVLDCTKERSMCYSKDLLTAQLNGEESCLFLNVYTTKLPNKTSDLKPVMVWIHGGAFKSGSGNSDVYGPDFLIQHDVIIVTFNYRFGLLGFLHFKNPSLNVPGNSAFKDQVLALKWVQKNIASFNGDPNNVTIFGECAGAQSVHLLMLSPMAKGLFHKAILQSGSATSSYVMSEGLVEAIANVLNMDQNDEANIFEVLSNMKSNELLKLQSNLKEKLTPSTKRLFGAVVEIPTTEPAFLTDNPWNIITSGNYSHVPVMMGYCNREGLFVPLLRNMEINLSNLITDKESIIPYMLKISKNSETSKELANKIHAFYRRLMPVDLEDLENTKACLLITDVFIITSVYSAIKNHIKSLKQPLYLYRLSADTDLNIIKKQFKIQKMGACHFDDIGYLFKTIATPQLHPGTLESDCMLRMTKLWTTFAKTGNPNPVKEDPLINVTWKPVENNKFHFLDIGENLTVGVNPESTRMKFWDEIGALSNLSY